MEKLEEKRILKAEDVASILDVSKSMAYKIIQKLNGELEEKGYITFSGRVPAKYFYERVGF